MKFSIALDSRKGRSANVVGVPDLQSVLEKQEHIGVRIVRLYGKGRYANVEAPEAAFEPLKRALGSTFIVSPMFVMETLSRPGGAQNSELSAEQIFQDISVIVPRLR